MSWCSSTATSAQRLGVEPGWVGQPRGPGTVFVSEDPDRLWARIGEHLLHDAVTYHSWQTDDIRSHVKSGATTVDELRAEGVYRILTPDECVALAGELGPNGSFTHHPLCGATSPEDGWESLELFADQVLPRVRRGRAMSRRPVTCAGDAHRGVRSRRCR